jgi:hypothetical protein
MLTLLSLELMPRPKRRSRNWDEFNSHNCDSDEVHTRVIEGAQRPFTVKECILSQISGPDTDAEKPVLICL